ncbi:MAG: RIP metalloprotease RseP [Candidatus Izemoplasmatales bacterium]
MVAVLSVFLNIILFMLVLSLVICIHELGHLYFAKKAGILCHEFAFGMGPRLWSKKVGETIYSIRAIPFGGFVSMAGEEIESEVVKVGDTVRLGFDEVGHVQAIVVSKKATKVEGFMEVTVERVDLLGKEGNELYINEYIVNKDASYVFTKNSIQIAPYNRNFNNKTAWERFKVMFGGPLMNLVLAFVLYLTLALIIGVPNYDSTVVNQVTDNYPASGVVLPGDEIVKINGVDIYAWTSSESIATVTTELSKTEENPTFVLTVIRDGVEVELSPIAPQYLFFGLGFASDPTLTDGLYIGSPLYNGSEIKAGDEIVSINGISFTTWAEVITYAKSYTTGSTNENPTVLVVNRDGEELTFSYVSYGEDVLSAMGYSLFISQIGIAVGNHFSLLGGIESGFSRFGSGVLTIYKTLALVIKGDQVGVSDLSGFIGIYSITSAAASQGILSLMGWVALLSVNLGVVNLLPIPALDGGRITFLIYEKITKRKIKPSVEGWINTVFFFMLIGLMIFISYNDILRLF